MDPDLQKILLQTSHDRYPCTMNNRSQSYVLKGTLWVGDGQAMMVADKSDRPVSVDEGTIRIVFSDYQEAALSRRLFGSAELELWPEDIDARPMLYLRGKLNKLRELSRQFPCNIVSND